MCVLISLFCGAMHHASIKPCVLSDSTVCDAPQFDAELCHENIVASALILSQSKFLNCHCQAIIVN